MPKLTHAEVKRLIRQYREAAREEKYANTQHVAVCNHATVHFTKDGAYVEATIWVPKEDL